MRAKCHLHQFFPHVKNERNPNFSPNLSRWLEEFQIQLFPSPASNFLEQSSEFEGFPLAIVFSNVFKN